MKKRTLKQWHYRHGGHTITVENTWTGERLYVDGALQDEQVGPAGRARLWGRLPGGGRIKVSLGGWLSVSCRVFVDDRPIDSD